MCGRLGNELGRVRLGSSAPAKPFHLSKLVYTLCFRVAVGSRSRPLTPGMHVVHRNTCRQKTPIHFSFLIFKIYHFRDSKMYSSVALNLIMLLCHHIHRPFPKLLVNRVRPLQSHMSNELDAILYNFFEAPQCSVSWLSTSSNVLTCSKTHVFRFLFLKVSVLRRGRWYFIVILVPLW